MAKKPARRPEYREVVYSLNRWMLLEALRKKASPTMQALENAHIESIVHGSIARGDVSAKSDIDIFIPSQASSFIIETALEKGNIQAIRRLIVQATPLYAMKAHIEIGENMSISFPLMKMRRIEREFYKFGGEINLENMQKGLRIAGVDKRLMLIQPTEKGHIESAIIGSEDQVAKLLGISVETVFDRVNTLTRRDHVGRTGVFIKQELPTNHTFEMVLESLAKSNPAVNRRLRELS